MKKKCCLPYVTKIRFFNKLTDELDIAGKLRTEVLDSSEFLLLGQEADTMLGNFDQYQAFSGKLSQVNFWNRILDEREIEEVEACRASSRVEEGSIVSWPESVGNLGDWTFSDGVSVTDENLCDSGQGTAAPTVTLIHSHTKMAMADAMMWCESAGGRMPTELTSNGNIYLHPQVNLEV